MDGLARRVMRLYAFLDRLDWLPKLVVRLGVGLMFLGGAVHKAGHLGELVAYFESLGIPAPRLQAPFVVAVELLGGAALMVGLATRPAAVMLAGTMVVALATAAVPEHHIHADWKGLLDFLYLPEWLLLLLLAWLAVAGAGRASADRLLREAFERRGRSLTEGDGDDADHAALPR